MPKYKGGLWVFFQQQQLIIEFIPLPEIVRVKESDIFYSRKVHSFISHFANYSAMFDDEISYPFIIKFFNSFFSIICRSVIHNDQLPVSVALINYTLDGLCN